jgi:hypothetical protein
MKPAKTGLVGLLMVCCIAFALEARDQSPAGLSVSTVEGGEQARFEQPAERLRIALRRAVSDQPKPVPDRIADRQQVARLIPSPVRVQKATSVGPQLILSATNMAYRTMERVSFTWHIEPFVAGVLYYISFGDGYGGWVSETDADHGYRQSGSYRVLLRARVGGTDIQSNEILVTVQEVVRPLLYRWLAAILGAVGAVLVISYVFVSARKKEGESTARADTRFTAALVRPHKDTGVCRLEFSTRAAVASDVRFQPVVDMGVQLMEQRITATERKEKKRG